VAERKDQAAIALSIESNLICPLTAFIAWDESEKVPIATHQLAQPDLVTAGTRVGCHSRFAGRSAAEGRHPGIGRFAGDSAHSAMLLRRLTRAVGSEELPPIRQTVASDELELKRELSDICHKKGVVDWHGLVKAIFDWIAEVSGDERAQRLQAVNRLIQELRVEAACFERAQDSRDPQKMDEACKRIHKMLKEFVDRLSVRK
jgi:hypothetical protein